MKLLTALVVTMILTGCSALQVQWIFHAEYGVKNEQASK